jgi:hypothetical protein
VRARACLCAWGCARAGACVRGVEREGEGALLFAPEECPAKKKLLFILEISLDTVLLCNFLYFIIMYFC